MYKTLLSAALLLIIFFTACHKKTPANPTITFPADTPGTAITITDYPLQVGHSWTYTAMYQDRTNPITTTDYTITVVSDTVVNNFHFFKMKNDNGTNTTPNIYYNLKGPQGLYRSFTYSTDFHYTINGIVQPDSIIHIDSATIFDTENLELKLPLALSDTFSSFDSIFQYDGFFRITTPAGIYNCVRAASPIFPYGQRMLYYSTKGLIMIKNKYPNYTDNGYDYLKSVNF